MLDLSAFRARFPEFKTLSDLRVQTALDDAEVRTDAGVFGDSTDEAHGALAADLLVSNPSGAETRLKDKEEPGRTVYQRNRERLEIIYCGFRGGAT